jgi:Arc/MetJ-type ribon-helix-helix transcriptional regulator
MVEKVSVRIPKDVYEGVKRRVEASEFKSVEEYVTYVLRQVLEQVNDESSRQEAYSKEDEEKIKERLRNLGYLD